MGLELGQASVAALARVLGLGLALASVAVWGLVLEPK